MRIKLIGAALGCLLAAFPAWSRPKKEAARPRSNALFQKKLSKDEQLMHALDRLTFGPRPGDMQRLRKMGLKKWVDLQLHPERIKENPELLEKLHPLESLRATPLEVWENYPQQQLILSSLVGKLPLPDDQVLRTNILRYASYYRLNNSDPEKKSTFASLDPIPKIEDFLAEEQIKLLKTGKPEQKRAVLAVVPIESFDSFLVALGPQLRNQLQAVAPVPLRRRMLMLNSPQQVLSYDLLSGKLDRAIYSNRQLAEQLADFWYNHFNVYLDKGNERFLVPAYEREAIQPNVLANFRTLLEATAKSPAMLYYLDNFQSVAPPAANARQVNKTKAPVRGLNENYARELMELHTLGVDGGYTQKDIIEVARCFTGWTLEPQNKGSVFRFNEKTHDKGEKLVLGVTIPAGRGMEDGLQVLDILAHHPSTARFISKKLAQRFVADRPPQALIDRMAKTFHDTDGDIRQVMKTMLASREFWSKGAYRAKLKSPLEMIASAARATDAEVDDPFSLANQIANLGQPLYRKVEPTGYLNTSDEWINSGSLLNRMNFALNFAQNRVQGVRMKAAETPKDSEPDVDTIARSLLFRNPTAQTHEAIVSAIEKQQATRKKPAPVSPALISGLVIGSPDFQRR
jgi:uncharacterized protein (DUF1800 family)